MTRTIRREARLYADDRARWGAGPWQDEPDILEWRDERFPSIALLVVRSEITGALCGYVGLPPGHPLHGKSADAAGVDAHGGLTYADECAGHICHVPGPGEPEHVWWLGFDCAHFGDVMPALEGTAIRALHGGNYRTLGYVMAEVERLAEEVGGRP